ncbi:HEXXH motif-containing putative peptide modification protein [Actinomadura sp. NPDC047616]|uniref:aKG-HExxH-type peptide beta-hydroxylase n=1 Tax=Actinomadura sp. NPDC047616 TaxID=3155914 RepID=UPI0033C752B3
MTAEHLADPVALMNGVPFLDDGFHHRRLLAGVAAVRHAEAVHAGHHAGRRAEAWLWPSAVHLLRSSAPMPAAPLTPSRQAEVKRQLAAASALIPTWEPLLKLPIRYARLTPSRGAISASSRDWPQHVLLADAAFTSDAELREQILHETAHQWLYLMQELWRLDDTDAPPVTLPSGTTNRSPAEALGAAHVAAVLIRLYRACGDIPAGRTAERVAHLTAYGAGCLDRAQHLTPAGARIAERIAEHLT